MARPRINGSGRKPARSMRKAVSYSLKKRCIESYLEGGDMDETIEAFFGDQDRKGMRSKKKQVRKWLADQVAIFAMCARGKGELQRRRQRGIATVLTRSAEEQIVLWVNSMRRDGIPVSLSMLRLKGLEVAKEVALSQEKFRASHSWAQKFMRRHRLSIRARTRQGQTTPSEASLAAQAFSGAVHRVIVEKGISQVFNADQTAVFFEYLPRRTIARRNSRTVWVKCGGKEKERATAMLLADSDGVKYAPFLIFKSAPATTAKARVENKERRHGFGRRVWKEVDGLQDRTRCCIYGNANAWWTSELSLEFLRFHFEGRDNRDDPVLLLWDDFSGHWTEEVVQYAASILVVLMKIPPRFTYVCQPADISWNKPLKDRLRRQWVEQLRQQISRHQEELSAKKRLEEQVRADVTREEGAGAVCAVAVVEAAHAQGETAMPSGTDSQAAKEYAFAVLGSMGLRDTDIPSSDTDSERQREEALVPLRRKRRMRHAGFQLTAPKRTDIAVWIADAWDALTPAIIVSGFKKACPLTDTRELLDAQRITPEDLGTIVDELSLVTVSGMPGIHREVDSSDDAISVYSDAGSTSSNNSIDSADNVVV